MGDNVDEKFLNHSVGRVDCVHPLNPSIRPSICLDDFIDMVNELEGGEEANSP